MTVLAPVTRSLALLALTASLTGGQQRLARVRLDSVEGCAWIVLRDGEVEVFPGRGAPAPAPQVEWAGEPDWRNEPRVRVQHSGSGRARVVQQPRAANGHAVVVEVPVPEVGWDGGDTWSFPHAAGAFHELELELVRAERFDDARLVRGALEREQQRAVALARDGELLAALEAWEAIALDAPGRELRARAIEEYAWLHRDLAFEPTDADRAKAKELHDEQVRATYGGEGTLLAGRRVMLLWPRERLEHPSVPRFLAELDLAFAALVRLAGQDPNERFGHRLCFFFMPQGAAWFDHHVGMGMEEFAHWPPFGTVYLHEMGHDFFAYTTSLIAPEPGFGEGVASLAQLRALDFLGFDRPSLARLYRHGVRLLDEHAARSGALAPMGAYFMGASLLASFGVREEDGGALAWDWDAHARLCARFRGLADEPLSPRDRYRHWAVTIAEEFGSGALDVLRARGFPVEREDAARVARERDVILPGLRAVRDLRARGDREGAERRLAELERATRHHLFGEIARERAALDGERSTDALGFLRAGWIHAGVAVAEGETLDAEREVGARALGSVTAEGDGRHHARRTLSAGGEVLVDPAGFRPLEVDAADGMVDLGAALAHAGRGAAVTWSLHVLETPVARRVDLRLAQDDDLAVLLNGAEVARWPDFTSLRFDHRWVPLDLRPGANLLALEIGNRGGDWGFGARLAGPDGLGVGDIVVRAPLAAPPPCARETVVWSVGAPDGEPHDLAWAGTAGWSERFPDDLELDVERARRGWSAIHPGPNDAWAGSRVHVFALEFELGRGHDREHVLHVWTVGQNGWTPPRLELSVNGRRTDWRLPGSPDAVLEDSRRGTPVHLELRLSPGVLERGENRLELSIPDGSWVLYDALELRRCEG